MKLSALLNTHFSLGQRLLQFAALMQLYFVSCVISCIFIIPSHNQQKSAWCRYCFGSVLYTNHPLSPCLSSIQGSLKGQGNQYPDNPSMLSPRFVCFAEHKRNWFYRLSRFFCSAAQQTNPGFYSDRKQEVSKAGVNTQITCSGFKTSRINWVSSSCLHLPLPRHNRHRNPTAKTKQFWLHGTWHTDARRMMMTAVKHANECAHSAQRPRRVQIQWAKQTVTPVQWFEENHPPPGVWGGSSRMRTTTTITTTTTTTRLHKAAPSARPEKGVFPAKMSLHEVLRDFKATQPMANTHTQSEKQCPCVPHLFVTPCKDKLLQQIFYPQNFQ